jgi:hypothetical protein
MSFIHDMYAANFPLSRLEHSSERTKATRREFRRKIFNFILSLDFIIYLLQKFGGTPLSLGK